jgi:predicted dehydrogenase
MSSTDIKMPSLVVGGGMISAEVVLPTLFQEQERALIGDVSVATRRAERINWLREQLPGRTFKAFPDPQTDGPNATDPDSFKRAIAELPPDGVVVVATPDNFHTAVINEAIRTGHHCIVQKPLCLKINEAKAIRESARNAGVYVYTDYHKRHDRAIRAARKRFRDGKLGQMLHGHAWIEERREMPLHWFANWCEQSSPFEYIGVHYADAYYFITGLKPKRLVAFGQKKLLPTLGKDAFDTVSATIQWEDDSVLFIRTGWVCSEHQSALTNQGLCLMGTQGEYWSDHKDRNTYFCTQEGGFEHFNPNFFKGYNDWDDPARTEWVGYGYDSIKQPLDDIRTILTATAGLDAKAALARRRELIAVLEPHRPLPDQALIGTGIAEAVRMSIARDSTYVYFGQDMDLSVG